MSQDIVLSRRSAERIARAVRIVERWPIDTLPGRTQPRPTAQIMAFTVTTQITAASGQLSPGSGKGTMLEFNASTGLFTVTSAVNITIWSVLEFPIKVGATVMCTSAYGQWWYDVTMCANAVTS